MNERFTLSKKMKLFLYAMMTYGVISVILSFLFFREIPSRTWANLLLNNIYILSIALCGGVFLSLHKLAISGWHTTIKRIPEAITSFMPIAGVLMLLIIPGLGYIYHWTHPAEDDIILLNKVAYLNIPFFIARMVVILGLWTLITWLMRRNSSKFDETGELRYFKRNRTAASLFIVFFAISSTVAAWDWLMSIDSHWFSTLYGWYFFIGLFVSGIAFIIVIIAFLKKLGLLKVINKEHIHDMGKYLFSFSIFWAYLWFSQYILIWYGHMPEETIYYVQRMNDFEFVFYLNLALNFIIPFFALMSRGAKRNIYWLATIAIIVLIGHWVDLYQMIMPGSVGSEYSGVSFIEIGMTVGYIGLFLFFILKKLSQKELIPKNDPFYKESLSYENL